MNQSSSPIGELLKLADETVQFNWLCQQSPFASETADSIAQALKDQTDHLIRTNLQQARHTANLLLRFHTLTGDPLHHALGLRAMGNVLLLGDGDCEAAIHCYDQASMVYGQNGRFIEQAQSLVGKVGGLYLLSRYQEALQTGYSVRMVLTQYGQWGALAGLLRNLALTHYRLGQGQESLNLLDEARQLCQQHGLEHQLPGIELNRAHALRILGRLRESLKTGQLAEQLFVQRGETIEAARAQLSQAMTHAILGDANQALAAFEGARDVYQADNRQKDVLLVERLVSDLHLQLGHFDQVLETCRRVRHSYADSGFRHQVAQTILNESLAYRGLGQNEQAMASLQEARALLQADGNQVGTAVLDLEVAALHYHLGQFEQSWQTAESCHICFQHHQQPIQAAQAHLHMAKAALALHQYESAQQLTHTALEIGQTQDVPQLRYQSYNLLGMVAQAQGDVETAVSAYSLAIEQLELLRGRWMVEFRADFLSHKEAVYEDIVGLYLDANQPEQALTYAERSKSRALVDLLSHHLDVRLSARSSADEGLVAQLHSLRDRRNQLHRLWESSQEEKFQTEAQMQLTELEKEIGRLWHTLLIRNADYAREASLIYGRSAPLFPLPLPADTLMIEFFVVRGELIMFLINQQGVTAHRLPGVLSKVAQARQLLNINLRAVPGCQPDQAQQLERGAKKQLHHLYQLLLMPLLPVLANYPRLVFVPHGAVLHYLPFQALYDGEKYLLERHEVSYLPSASLLAQLQPGRAGGSCVAVGYSWNGRLPFAAQEAAQVAALTGGVAYVEEEATVERITAVSSHANILHLATHGSFNPQNPLFSGLTLADGPLNTLDIFNLRLNASLVTLSACQTGRSVVGGGDELQGLMRAFLYAGAASLLLTQWQVADHSTQTLMHRFYQHLMAGSSKTHALHTAQRTLLADPTTTHPYYWAPFFLVGDNQKLKIVPEKNQNLP